MDDEPEQIEYGPTRYVNWEPEHLCAGVVCWCGTSLETVVSDDGEEETTIVTHRSMEQIIDAAVAEQTQTQAAELARMRADLEQARAERDAEQKRRVFAEEGVENLRFLKNLWENESGFYLRKYGGLGVIVERQRRTIRALVVAARALRQAAWYLRMGGVSKRDVVMFVRTRVGHINRQSGQQAWEG